MKPENVVCPLCSGPMISRTSQHGVFWGCKAYPQCKGTRDSMGRSRAERQRERGSQDSRDEPDIDYVSPSSRLGLRRRWEER